MNTIHHLSHIDLDGYSCQLVMKEAYENIKFYNANYGAEVGERLNEILEALKANKKDASVLITDLNLTMDESKWISNEIQKLKDYDKITIKLQLLDHHGSGQDSANKFDWYLLDTTRSATQITFDYVNENFSLSPEAMAWIKPYVAIVDAVDLWHQEKHDAFEYGKVCMRLVTETRELNRVMFSNADRDYKHALLFEAAQMLPLDNSNILLDETIHALKKNYFKKDNDDTLDNLATAFIVELLGAAKADKTIYYKGYKGYLSYALGNTSIVGNAFLTTYDEYDFIVDVGPRGTMSLRASNKVNVSLIAKEWAGGGGHPNASGGRLSGFKEQFRYDKVKRQIQNVIDDCESRAGTLEYKKEDT
ncbi:phosphoesterase [Sulfurimonas sp. MAG313]|nr:phosphoesterase [Sulfurimonas sp. MAG313]MDF1881001.1 phosphoesterase [Sulfurimonas sp. MAG313]